MMSCRNLLLALAIGYLAACSSTSNSVAPLPLAQNSDRGQSVPLAIRYGTQTLLLAVDRQNLAPGAVARILGYGAYGTTPLFTYYMKIPNLPGGIVHLGNIISDAKGRIFVAFFSAPPYNRGAIAVFNTVPPNGATRDPDAIIQLPPADSFIFAPFPVENQILGPAGLAVDSSGRLYVTSAVIGLGVSALPANASGSVTPLGFVGPCGENVVSVALDTQNNYYVGCTTTIYEYPANNFGNTQQFIRYLDFFYQPYFAVGRDGSVYAAGQGINFNGVYELPRVSVFAPGASGSAQPIRQIYGSRTSLSHPFAITVCPDGLIYVAQAGGNDPDQNGSKGPAGILVFKAASDGNVAPIKVLAPGDATIAGIGF